MVTSMRKMLSGLFRPAYLLVMFSSLPLLAAVSLFFNGLVDGNSQAAFAAGRMDQPVDQPLIQQLIDVYPNGNATQMNYAEIAEWSLLGEVSTDSTTGHLEHHAMHDDDVPVNQANTISAANLSAELIGLAVSSREAGSFAVLALGKQHRLFRKGDRIDEATTISAIEHDRVWLSRNGQRSYISLKSFVH